MTGDSSALTGGAVTVVTTQHATDAANEVQRIGFSQPPGGGTFTLTWDAGGGMETTAAIAYNASPASVQAALEGLATPGVGDFTVTGADGGPWIVEFKGDYAGTDVELISGDGSSLMGGGSQSLTLQTTARSRGPNHFDDPDNWTGGAVPNSQDALFFNGGKVHCLYGLKQRVTFSANPGTDTITFEELADFVEGQALRLFTTDTLPAGFSTATTYYIKNLDFDAGTCQLSLTAGSSHRHHGCGDRHAHDRPASDIDSLSFPLVGLFGPHRTQRGRLLRIPPAFALGHREYDHDWRGRRGWAIALGPRYW